MIARLTSPLRAALLCATIGLVPALRRADEFRLESATLPAPLAGRREGQRRDRGLGGRADRRRPAAPGRARQAPGALRRRGRDRPDPGRADHLAASSPSRTAAARSGKAWPATARATST